MRRNDSLFPAGSLTGILMARLLSWGSAVAQSISPAAARAIAKEAHIYGFPLVNSYRVQYSYFCRS
jgi:hypothetical protein